VAKARAARYNLTLRSMELQNAVNNSKASALKKKDEAPPAGRRVSNLGKKSQRNVEAQHEAVATAMNHRRNPTMSKQLVEAAAAAVDAHISQEEAKPSMSEAAKAKEEAEAAALVAAQEEEARILAEQEAKEEAEKRADAQTEAAAAAAAAAAAQAAAAEALKPEPVPEPEQGASFEMTSLQDALDTGDQDAINKAVVTEFIAGHDPAKLPEVEKMLEENKGKEAELMKDLAEQYADPVEVEIQTSVDVIVKVESSPPDEPQQAPAAAAEPSEEIDIIEAQRMEAERLRREEEVKIAAMDEGERERYMESLAREAAHNEEKDRHLKAQLNVYANGAGGGVNIMAGRGRGRGKRPVSTKGAQTEYIVSASNAEGEWSVNTE
jgi:hypothetical protein